jgi:hypothetical protein
MSETHLAGITGKQIPARSKDGKDTGENKDAQEVGIVAHHRQEEQYQDKDYDGDTGGENEHFVFDDGKQLSQVK